MHVVLTRVLLDLTQAGQKTPPCLRYLAVVGDPHL